MRAVPSGFTIARMFDLKAAEAATFADTLVIWNASSSHYNDSSNLSV
jgi:hypothetical protein